MPSTCGTAATQSCVFSMIGSHSRCSCVATHEHREWLPIIENTQDWVAAVPQVEGMLREFPATHGLLIRRHGLYTWGATLSEAKRQVEILEFLLEAMGRKRGKAWQP